MIEDVIVGRNLAAFDELVSPDFVEHEVAPGFPAGREGSKQLFAMLHQAFPDLQVEIHDLVAQGNKVTCRMTWHGTQTGEFLGIPPTGKHASWDVYDMVRMVDGRAVEHWGLMDQLSVLQQLGVIPAPETAGA